MLILVVEETLHLHSFFSCHLLANIIEDELQHVSSLDCSLLPHSLFASSIPLPMVLFIFLNGLYSAKGNEEKQDLVRSCISRHHRIKRFDEQNVELAVARYVFTPS